MPRFRHKKTTLAVLVFVLAVLAYVGFSQSKNEAVLAFLNVGQGDAMLLSLPGGTQILVDGGPSDKIVSSLQKYIPFYDKEIELVVLTHPHSDHLRGLNYVLENYRVKNVLISGAYYESSVYKNFIDVLSQEKGLNVFLAHEGDQITWRNKVIMKVLSPSEIALGKGFGNIHESSVVSFLDIGGLKFLLMGDAEENLEDELVANDLIKDVDVLKVGHHGSKTSTSFNFLNTSLPEVAVIEVGNNSYGHPTALVLDRLKEFGSKILRTDQEGDIIWRFKADSTKQ